LFPAGFVNGVDGANGLTNTYFGVHMIWMMRFLACPSRSNAVSMPTLRRNVATRRTRPDRDEKHANAVTALAADFASIGVEI